MFSFTPTYIENESLKKLEKFALSLLWLSLSSCTYSPNYSKVDASNHSVTNYNYSARQMAIGIPNQPRDSMVITTYEDEENGIPHSRTPYPSTHFTNPAQIKQPPFPHTDSQKFDTSYIFPNPFIGIIGIFANSIKNFNDRMEHIANNSFQGSSRYFCKSPSSNYTTPSYAHTAQFGTIYGERYYTASNAYPTAAQILNRNR